MPLTEDEIDLRIIPAQEVSMDITKCMTERIRKPCQAQCDAIGALIEYIFFPLLTLVANFMGPAFVYINSEWREPVLLWTVVAADKGQKKSPALNRFSPAIETMEKELRNEALEKSRQKNIPDEHPMVPQITAEHFSFEEFHFALKRNEGRLVGLYDEIIVLYELMDKNKGGTYDRKTFLSLYNAKTWRRNLRNIPVSTVEKPWFNFAGFAQPEVVVNMLNSNDYDGFCDRQFYVCPPNRDVDFDDLKPVPADIPSFAELFRVIRDGSDGTDTYRCNAESKKNYVEFHNEMNTRKKSYQRREKDRRSIVLNAKGQVLRISAVVLALDQALSRFDDRGPRTEDDEEIEWSNEILAPHLNVAIEIMEHLMRQKFALGKPSLSTQTATSVDGEIPGPSTELTHKEQVKLERMLEIPSPIPISDLSNKRHPMRMGRLSTLLNGRIQSREQVRNEDRVPEKKI